MFRSSISSLEEFRRESVDETARVVEARNLLARADDVGEQYVEAHDAVAGEEFRSTVDGSMRSLDGLADLSSEQETAIIAEVRARWAKIDIELNEASNIPLGDDTGTALDPFHDDIDGAMSMLADLNERRGVEIADEIATMRRSEQSSSSSVWRRSSSASPRRSSLSVGRAERSRLGSACSKARRSGSARTTCPSN